MAKKWSDVAGSSAFQALSLEEQEEARNQYFESIVAPRVAADDLDSVREQFFADTALRPQGVRQELPSDITPSQGRSATPMGQPDPRLIKEDKGIIQRIGEFLKPEPKSVMENYRATPEEMQAERDKRLSYGAGPIRPEVAAAAAEVNRGRAKTTSPTVAKVAKEMERRGERPVDVFEIAQNPALAQAARDAKAEEFRSVGEWTADTLSSLAQGATSLVQLPVNIISPSSSLAESLRETQKELQAQESDVLRAQRDQLRERVQREDGFFDKYAATVVQLATNPALGLSEAAKQIPMFLGIVGTARLAGGAVGAASQVSPALALSEALTGGAVRAGATTAGGVGASMVAAGGDAAGGVYEKLTDRKQTPLSVWEQNPDFQRLTAEGKSTDDAIQEIATAKARLAAVVTAPLGLLGFMGAESAVASRGLGRATAEALTVAGAGKMFAKDIIGEQLEEGGTQFGGNVISRTVDPNQKLSEGVPEAMGTALVTSAPFSAVGARSQYLDAQQAQQQQPGGLVADQIARSMLDVQSYDPTLIDPTQTSKISNFTPPGSPTQEAGLVDIVVPVPEVNPDTEREFGLDKLRMGGSNVGTSGAPGGLAVPGSDVAGDLTGGSLGVPGLRAGDTGGGVGGSAGVNAPDGGKDVSAGGAGQQPLANLTRGYNNADGQTLVEPWFGRKGGGYTTEGDAQQALPGRQRMFPDLDWKIEAMPNGRYMLAGYTQETNLGTQTTQAQQGASQRQAQVAGSAGAGMGVPLAAGGIAPAADGTAAGFGELAVQPGSGSRQAGSLTTREGAEAAALTAPIKLAPPAPLRTVGKVITLLQSERGVNIEIDNAPLTDVQQAASGLARMLGKTLTILKAETPASLPNGLVVPEISTKDIFVASDSDDAPLSVVVHEVYHTLPDDKRQALNAQLLTLFREDQRGEFADQFGYDAKNDKLIDEEIPAFMAQAISKRADFWEQLREKMGNREFAGLAKVILDKLTTIVTGARKEYGDAFVKKYIKDVEKARDLLTTAYAEAMQAQGLTPDTGSMTMAASNRSRVDMNFKDVIKRTPELQEGMAKLQAGEITKEDYDRLVNEFKPVEPYKSVPAPVTPEAARFALANGKGQSEEKAAKFGLPSRDMKAGEPTQLRLDIPSYSEHGAWVVSVHRPEGRSFGAGKVVGYEPVASVQNAEFGMLEKSAAKIAAGSAKGTIATIMGNWKPTSPAEAKLKADQALKSKDWVQVGMDPERHSYFYDRASMEPVVAADEVIQIGPLVLAKNPTYGKKSDFMFSNRVQEPEIGAKLRARIEADYEGAVRKYSQLKDSKGGRVLDADIARELSPEYRADRSRAPEVHEAVSDFIQRTFEERMAEPGTGDIVAFMAGGGGAGKSTAEKMLAPILDQATTVLDGTLSSYDKAERNVQRVLDSGRQVRIVYVYREPVEALINGVLTRAKTNGRSVPIDALVKGHAGSSTVVRKLQEKFGDNPDFKLYAVDNSLGRDNAEIKDISEITPVIIDGLKERLLNATEQQLQAGQIDDKLYRATVGRQADAGTEAQSQVGGREIRSRLGGGVQEGGQLGGSGNPVIQFSKRAGKYPYSVDDKGRLTFTGDIDRVRFLTRQVATGTPTKDKTAVVFKAADADAVLEALKNEPKANARVAAAIVKKLGLTDAELKSTSLEFQTGEPGDRAFSAPLQGGIPETVQFLEDRRRQSGLRLLNIAVPEDQDLLAKLIAAEALGAIRSSGNALEWYDETIARTLAMAAVKYPELGDDVNAQTTFRLAIAIASQGLNVENNLGFAMRQYDAFRREGKFPEIGEGESAEAMVGNFRLANELMAEMGPDLFRRFLATEFTIGELNQAGFDPGGELVDEKVLGSSVFGPKIGFGFYSNLNGNFEPVTMDMWFMRTIGRLTGSLRAFDAEKFGAQLDKFRAAFGATGTDGVYASRFDADLVARARESQEAAIELARQVKKAHERDFRENRAAFDAGERKKTKLVYAAETMIQSVDKPKDVPASGGERRLLREVVRKAVATLEQAYGRRVPPAAMQALIWYPEQELYKALGVKLSVTSQDYAGAIEKILTKEGYDGNELRTAAESGSRRIRQADGGNARRSAQGDGQGAGQTRSLQGDERGGFIRSRYERTQLEQERVAPKRKGVVFEVAPDPNNAELTARWNSLSQAQRLGISERVAREIVPKVLERLGTSGIIANQVGSYEENTNPSFVLYLDKGDALEVAKALGFALAQDSVMVLSPKEFKGGEAVGALAIEIGNKTPAEVDAIYQSLREIEVKGERPIAGQSMANGVMTILNYSKVPTKQLALLVDQKLNKGYTILTRDVFAAFPDKKEYDYASEANDGRGSRADLRKWSRSVRAEATRAVERELGGITIQRSNRATGLAEPARGSGARPDEGDAGTIVGVHYGTQANITSLSGDRYGSGLRGGERRRLDEPGVDPRIKKRVYFYLANNNADYPSAESGLGSHAYRANLDNMYDPSRASAEDKQRVRDVMQGSSANAFESAVLDAGFQGYVNREMGMAVVLNSDVPVEYEGTVLRNQMTPRVMASNRVKLADDLADQEKFLQQKAEAAGYKTIDEFVDKDYEGFAAAAKEWRDAYPVDVMYSNRAAPDTPAFKRWFGDSKVVDAKGEPLVVYHGTEADVETFKVGESGGIFMSTDSNRASMFAGNDSANVLPVYAQISDPMVIDDEENLSPSDIGDIIYEAKAAGFDGVHIIKHNDWMLGPSGGDTWIAFRPEQIKSAIGNSGEYDPNNPSIVASNRAREGWIIGRDELGRPTFGAGAKAYRYVADVANNVLARIGLKPISTDLGRAMRQMKVEIAKAREMTVDAAEQLGKLSQQEREMISDVIEGELKRGAKPPKRVLELAASMQGIMSEQTAELVRLGMLSEEAAGRWDGKYLPRFYESKLKDEAKGWAKAAKALLGRQKTMQGIGGSNLKGRGLFQTIPVEELEAWLAEGWEERDPNFDPDTDTEITVWRDYTREERDDMGEIRDAMFRFVMGYNKSQRDISLGRLYENLANTVASKREKEGYVQVPRTNVEDTYARRYGKLAGMWVPQEVLDHLVAFDQSQQNELLKMYLKGMSLWKEGKTVLNPVSHANNVLSNVTMAHFAGVSYWDVNKYIGATRDLIKRAPMVTEAEDAGLWTGTMTQAELVQLLPDQLKVLAAKEESKAGKAFESVWNAMSFWLRKPMGKAYEAEDLYFRYLIYRDARQRGLEPADAVDFAQKYIFTYDDLPKTARFVRNFFLPFFAYTYKVVPTLAETALQYPWRYAAPAMALYTINAAMYAFAAGLGGGEDEDWWTVIRRYVTDPEFRKKAEELEANERPNIPPWMKGQSLSLGTQKTIRLGVDELTGLPVFLDVSRIFPGGDIFDMHNNAGGMSWPAPITPNNPILTALFAIQGNKDTFRGKELVDPLTDTSAEAARIRAEWIYKQIAPAIAVGNSHFDRAMNVIANQVGQPINLGFAEYTGIDKQGQPVQAKYAAMQTFGIKATPIDLESGESIQKSEVNKAIGKLEQKIRVTQKQEQRGSITSSQAEAQREILREKRQRLKDGLTIEGEERK